MLWVMDELNYDRYHEKADNIYRVCVDAYFGSPMVLALVMAPAAPVMVDEYPEVLAAARMSFPGKISVKYEDNLLQEQGVAYADNSIFDIFTFPFVKGDSKTALNIPYTVVMTEEMAEKYFGDDDPLGKIIVIGGKDKYTVTGVVENVPANSHFTFNMLRSMETLETTDKDAMGMWFNIQYYTYILLDDKSDYEEFEGKLVDFVDRHMGESLAAAGGTLKCFLQPLTDIHLHSKIGGELSANGSITSVYLFTGIAIFILIIAVINFINLSTAKSAVRAIEIGVRKTFGANRISLIGQFLFESILFTLIAALIAFMLAELSLPFFSQLSGKHLSLNPLEQLWMLPVFLIIILIVGFLAGVYPALFLSGFRVITVLRIGFESVSSRSLFRKSLVVVQFTISIALIIGTLTVFSQLRFMKKSELGFNKDQVLVIPQINRQMTQNLEPFKKELMDIDGVLKVTATSLQPAGGIQMDLVIPEGFADDQPQIVHALDIDYDYLNTMEIQLLQGRNFSRNMKTDLTESIMVNETAVRQFNWENPLGKTLNNSLRTDSGFVEVQRKVVGVVRDFHLSSLHNKIEPLILGLNPSGLKTLSIRVSPVSLKETIAALERKWNEIDPDRPFVYYFLDEAFDKKYQAEEQLSRITLYFSILAVFIGCLGLFGMSAFSAERRTKEIGIRKVMGATVTNILRLIYNEFMLLILISNVIAIPAAWYFTQRWLDNFAYRIGNHWWVYLFTVFLALSITLITISFQALKAATSDPVKALRYE